MKCTNLFVFLELIALSALATVEQPLVLLDLETNLINQGTLGTAPARLLHKPGAWDLLPQLTTWGVIEIK